MSTDFIVCIKLDMEISSKHFTDYLLINVSTSRSELWSPTSSSVPMQLNGSLRHRNLMAGSTVSVSVFFSSRLAVVI